MVGPCQVSGDNSPIVRLINTLHRQYLHVREITLQLHVMLTTGQIRYHLTDNYGHRSVKKQFKRQINRS